MKRTTASNSVSGKYVDRNTTSGTQGTALIAEDRNNLQEEICTPIEAAGFTLDGTKQDQLYKAIIALSKPVGEMFPMAGTKDLSETFPAIAIDASDVTVDATTPDLVTFLRSQKTIVAGTSSWSVTVSGSVVTFGTSVTSANLLLAALYESALCHGTSGRGSSADTASYTAWRSINVAGTDYAITAVGTTAGTVTVDGTPTSGSQTAIVYTYRIAGSATTARILKGAGRSLVAQGDSDGEYLAGYERRDYMQGHRHYRNVGHDNELFLQGASNEYMNINYADNAYYRTTSNVTGELASDTTHGIPRTGYHTETRGMGAYLYIWAGRYVA